MKQQRLLLKLVLPLLFLWVLAGNTFAQTWNPNHSVGTVTGVYNFSYNQIPAQLVEIYPAAFPNTGLTYLWQSCATPVGAFVTAAGTATTSSYNFTAPLTQTTYFRRVTTNSSSASIYSNLIKISIVSVNWEDINYIREHDIKNTGVTTWTAADQLAIGPKQQTTTYLDGLGRSVEKVAREVAAPASGTLWGDMVKFSQYDAMGRQPLNYLAYTTTSQSGKYKTAVLTEQPLYYSTNYNETAPYSAITFDKSPLNRVKNIKEPGTAWAGSPGNTVAYDVNSLAENVQQWAVDYIQGNPPINKGAYPANRLYKLSYTDANGKQVIEYTDKSGQLILKKVQIDAAPTVAHVGWICTYNIYDDLGLLRFQLQPEAVKYLDANSWSFAGTNGTQVLNELCFQNYYDNKGNVIWKKSPGASAINMLYDVRGRLVFTQDGNQAALPTHQWTATLYNELDKEVATALYNTSSTIATLQSDINNASLTSTPVTIVNAGTSSVTINTNLNPVSSANLNNTAVCTLLKYVFYDNYSFPLVKTFNTGFTNTTAYSTGDPNVIPIAASKRTLNAATGTMTRVLGGNMFLAATYYFDEKGHGIQTLEDNIKSGADITTFQFHFDGRLLSTCSDHTTSGTGYTNFKTLTKYNFDKIGHITSVQKQYGSNAMKTISSTEFDDIGRIKAKHLDPGYANATTGLTELESLNYTYNIHNQLKGINKDYALKTSGVYNKWGHYFGMYLGYDNRDNVFTKQELNGQVTGIEWNTMGDDAQRRYDYNYDNSGRLVKAAFTEQQHPGDGWANTKTDFSVNGTSGQMTYDLNGNLLTMLQKGVMPGTAAPLTIDDLRYAYTPLSNKMVTVTDQMVTPAQNGLFGDMKDGANGAGADYVYDNNGNILVDLNKNVQSVNGGAAGTKGIVYNYLDKPDLIRIVGKGTIRVVYSADGEKLQRAFIPDAGGTSVITTYINEFVYSESATITTSTPSPLGATPALSYINFETGRVRVMSPVSQDNGYEALSENGNITLPNAKSGAFDYFIFDYQKNVRMVLTEETHSARNTCTMESSRASVEEPIFGQTGGGNEVAGTRFAKPSGWTGNTSLSVSRLGNLAGKIVGPNTLQKVMAGDRVSAITDYYFQTATGGNNPNIVSTVLSSLVQAITGGTAANSLVKSGAPGISTQLNGTPGFVSAVKPVGSAPAPQAYLTILFFDERFNFISATDGGVAQSQVAATVTAAGAQLSQLNIKAPKNGYVYVYVSNRDDQNVYFDNFKVTIQTGNIIEENHYYAYGLKIAAISSRKIPDVSEGSIKNNRQLQGAFNELDDDIGWNDFELRNYDPQIGKWIQQDPYQQFASPYVGMANDPVNTIDPSGGIGIPCPGTSAFSIFLSNLGSAITNTLSAASPVLQYINIGISVTNTATHIEQVIQVSNTINGQITTMQAGTSTSGKKDANDDDDGDTDWMPLYKADLKKYYIKEKGAQPSENDLGTEFEDLFLEFAENDPEMRMSNVRPNGTKFTGGFRNTVPDFVGDAEFYTDKPAGIKRKIIIKGADWYELKQQNGSLTLSSNEDQIAGHIDNLRNSTDYAYMKYGRFGYQSKLYVVTTADAKFSANIAERAFKNNVLYDHIQAEYRIVNGKYEFRFKKVISYRLGD